MTLLARARPPAVQHDGVVARLVEAEREWKARLDAARERAAAIESDARAECERLERDAAAGIRDAVAARVAELSAETTLAVAAARDALTTRQRRYTDAPEALVDRVAAQVAARAPWFDPVGGAP